MLNLKKLLFGRGSAPAKLADDVRGALEAWRKLPAPPLDEPHFHSRYVVVDVSVAGLDAEVDALLGIAAVAVVRGGVVPPEEVIAIDFSGELEADAFDRQLMAFLAFMAKAPLVSYRVPLVRAFLERAFRERLGLDFQPDWIDLAWLLPDLFNERIDGIVPRDAWLESFHIPASPGRDSVVNAIALARLLQVALPRAVEREADTPGKVLEKAMARRQLRQSG